METKENMKLYESLREVPTDAQKQFNNGRFSGTDINPMWRIKRLTEMFGPCGFGWYFEVVNRSIEKSLDNTTLCTFIGVNLFIRNDVGEWSRPIYGEGGNTFCTVNKNGKIITTDEAYKMALTDAIGNATKQLGLGADVWWESDSKHSTKYDQQQELAKNNEKPAPAHATDTISQEGLTDEQKKINACKTKTEINELFSKNGWTDRELINYAKKVGANLPA